MLIKLVPSDKEGALDSNVGERVDKLGFDSACRCSSASSPGFALGTLEFFEQDIKAVVTHGICRLQFARGLNFDCIKSIIRGILRALEAT
jgi:hypothetical protein